MALLKYLTDFPEHIDKGQFVLRLTEGVTDPQATVAADGPAPNLEKRNAASVICWAGYDHLQQAQAISAYYVRVQTEFGGSDDPRLIPLLASLTELLPWLKQWHNEPNASFDGLRMGDYFDGFVNEEARALGKTLEEIRAWTPPKKATKRAVKPKKTPKGE